MSCRTFIPDGEAIVRRAHFHVWARIGDFAAARELRRHLATAFPVEHATADYHADVRAEVDYEVDRHMRHESIAARDERTYREHNITRTKIVPTRGGRVKQAPNPPHLQCGCDRCAAHQRRAAVTGVAAPGKEM